MPPDDAILGGKWKLDSHSALVELMKVVAWHER
jgi:hypothetical protein